MGANQIQIQWFPGHMTKAKREMLDKMKAVDFVIELRDARIPNASKNPMIDEICGNKPRLMILTKSDKADKQANKQWKKHLTNSHVHVLCLNVLEDDLMNEILEASFLLMHEKIERQKRKGIRPRAMRAMVIGIPNVGKSTLINRLAKKKIAKTGDRPGVTKALQWIKVNQNLELLDTPGILWPKFDDEKTGILLAITGAIRDEILPLEEIGFWAMKYLIAYHPQSIIARYHVETLEDPNQVFFDIAKKRNFYKKGNVLDYERALHTFIRELRDERIDRITWELPDEN